MKNTHFQLYVYSIVF